MFVEIFCRSSGFPGIEKFDHLPRREDWVLKKSKKYTAEFIGDIRDSEESSGTYCFPAYNAKQIARLLIPDLFINLCMSTNEVLLLIGAEEIYRWQQPYPLNFRAVFQELM